MAIRSGVRFGAPRRGFLACCMLIAGGCDITRDPVAFEIVDGPIAVHAVLVAGERHFAVLVTRYESTGEIGFGSAHRLVPVAGAEVRLSSAGRSTTLGNDGTEDSCIDEDTDIVEPIRTSLAAGCYTGVVQDGIAIGAHYELHVTLRDGTVVTGEAEVPAPSTIRTPAAGSDLEVRWGFDEDPAPPHPLAWTNPGPDHAVRLRLEADSCGAATSYEPDPDDLTEPVTSLSRAIDLTGRDSATVGGWYVLCPEEPTGVIDGALQLAVFPLAYAEYLDGLARSESIPLEDASVGLSGAVGAFTGAAVTRQPVRLIVR